MKKAPETYMGKRKVFEETFCSPFLSRSKEGAERVLGQIRLAHPESKGWVEIDGYVEQLLLTNEWRAIRHHAQYK